MSGDEHTLHVERLRGETSPLFARRVVELEPGATLDHRAAPWQEAIVFVTAGELEVACRGGECHCFRQGDILTLARLPVRSAHNSGAAPTRLLAIWRRAAAQRSPVSVGVAGRHTKKDRDPE